MPETEAMLTIAPLPCRSMCGSTCLQVRNMLFKFTSLTRSQLSSLVSTGPPTSTMPTLLCRTSIRPNDLMQASTIAATSSARDTSPATAMQMPPSLSMIRFGLDGGSEDLCSLAGEEHRRRLAVAPPRGARSCSRNQSHLVFEPIAHAFPPIEATAMCAYLPCRDNQICDSLQTTVRAASGPSGNSAPMRSSPDLIRLRRNEQGRIWRWRDT